jgi:hypothetical protein
MPPERALLCHGLGVTTGLLTDLGSLIVHGLATGDPAFARRRTRPIARQLGPRPDGQPARAGR